MVGLSIEEIIIKKGEIRQEIKTERKALSEEERLSRSAEIWERFKREVLDGSRKNIMFYYSFDSEVHTRDIIRELAWQCNLFLPKMQNREIVVCEYKLGDFMEENKHGIFEPDTPVIENPCLGIVIVPGIAFDREGNRLGWGLGCYDRFLAKYKGTLRIAPAYSFQVLEKQLPCLNHDQKIDIIITERGVINTRAG